MSLFRTNIQVPNYSFRMDHTAPVFSMGSCFAEHMAQRLEECKIPQLLNPFGILYNPYSIANALQLLMENKTFTQKDLFEHQGLWHSWEHHGHFSQTTANASLAKINRAFAAGRAFLLQSKVLIITLDTAHVFEHKEHKKIVANCHKIPTSHFSRRRLTVSTIQTHLQRAFTAIKSQIPDIQIITTVSPVRHLRDGLLENQRSKATLLLALAGLEEALDFVHYFPAYELLMDDLRDYRFYEQDMIHPSSLAVDYIWGHFQNAFFDTITHDLNKQIKKVVTASRHRPFHEHSPQHQAFLKAQLVKIEALQKEYPHLDFSKEQTLFTKQLIKNPES